MIPYSLLQLCRTNQAHTESFAVVKVDYQAADSRATPYHCLPCLPLLDSGKRSTRFSTFYEVELFTGAVLMQRPVTLAITEAEAGGWQVQELPGLQSKFRWELVPEQKVRRMGMLRRLLNSWNAFCARWGSERMLQLSHFKKQEAVSLRSVWCAQWGPGQLHSEM